MSSLDELGIKAVVLAFMSKGEIQISTQDANASSFVTKVNNNLYKIIARVFGISLPATGSNSWMMPPFFQTLDESASIDDFVEE